MGGKRNVSRDFMDEEDFFDEDEEDGVEDAFYDEDEDVDDEDLDMDDIIAMNDGLIEDFEDYMRYRRFSGSQVSSYLKCLELFSNDYLTDFAVGSLGSFSKEKVIKEFLVDYFIRKVCRGKDDLEQMVQALRSFYSFVAEIYIEDEEGKNALRILKQLDKDEDSLYKKWGLLEGGYEDS